jgi:hypothetical protein
MWSSAVVVYWDASVSEERAEINMLGELVEKLTEKFDNINIVGTRMQ